MCLVEFQFNALSAIVPPPLVRPGLREERHQVVVVVQHRNFVRLESFDYVEQFDVLWATTEQTTTIPG
ncbi:hypothetical protein GCM10010912_69670 [Paenibacillus albidus]|uniref:Uncharacterized protein n=1 Tax=Paenibacillus albidus TaxID=2041023 RepID=A0A917LED7_9BACL|nr:hypothetical protein GCM10010912_69670 [Paenibacillus albidus]